MKTLFAVVAVVLTLAPLTIAGTLFVRFVVVSSCHRCGFPTVRTDYFGRGHQTDECLRCGYIQDTPRPEFRNGHP